MKKLIFIFSIVIIALFSFQNSFKVSLKTAYNYDAFGNTVSYIQPVVLLNNGVVIKNLKLAPNKINFSEYARTNTKDVGTWKTKGTGIEVRFANKKTENWTSLNDAIAANSGEKLNGLYLSSGATASRILGQMFFYADGTVDLISSKKGVRQTVKAKYFLDGYSINLTLQSGTSMEQLFAFLPKNGTKNINSFVIGTDVYIKSK
jgi:hypothetical protein